MAAAASCGSTGEIWDKQLTSARKNSCTLTIPCAWQLQWLTPCVLQLISLGADHMVKVWDLRNQKGLQTHVSHRLKPSSVSSMGLRCVLQLISLGADHVVKVWDLRNQKCLQTCLSWRLRPCCVVSSSQHLGL